MNLRRVSPPVRGRISVASRPNFYLSCHTRARPAAEPSGTNWRLISSDGRRRVDAWCTPRRSAASAPVHPGPDPVAVIRRSATQPHRPALQAQARLRVDARDHSLSRDALRVPTRSSRSAAPPQAARPLAQIADRSLPLSTPYPLTPIILRFHWPNSLGWNSGWAAIYCIVRSLRIASIATLALRATTYFRPFAMLTPFSLSQVHLGSLLENPGPPQSSPQLCYGRCRENRPDDLQRGGRIACNHV